MNDLFAWLKLIILLPYIAIRALYVFVSMLIYNKHLEADKIGYKRWSVALSVTIWLVLASWLYYQSQFISITYVYACPSSNSSKCYKVRADYVPKDCEDTEWDNRGAHGGSCTDPYFERIIFNNGGYISFDYCDMSSKDTWTCFAEDENDGIWNLEISDVIKVKK